MIVVTVVRTSLTEDVATVFEVVFATLAVVVDTFVEVMSDCVVMTVDVTPLQRQALAYLLNSRVASPLSFEQAVEI